MALQALSTVAFRCAQLVSRLPEHVANPCPCPFPHPRAYRSWSANPAWPTPSPSCASAHVAPTPGPLTHRLTHPLVTHQVLVSEPSVADTIAILRGIKERYETHHGVHITDRALVVATELSDRYITTRFLPDKVRRE